MPDEYGLPDIPLSELRNIYRQAQLYIYQGGFDEKALWRLMVAIEVNSRLANQWYSLYQEEKERHAQNNQNIEKSGNDAGTSPVEYGEGSPKSG